MKTTVLALTLLLLTSSAFAQRTSPPSKVELAQITERGRRLAEYDVAAWYASDAVVATKPNESSVTRYVARKTGDSWIVVFGRLNETRDKFLVVYEASQAGIQKNSRLRKTIQPKKTLTSFFSPPEPLKLPWQTSKARRELQCRRPASRLESVLRVRGSRSNENRCFPVGLRCALPCLRRRIKDYRKTTAT